MEGTRAGAECPQNAAQARGGAVGPPGQAGVVEAALETLGLAAPDVEKLKGAREGDAKSVGQPSIGRRTVEWLGSISKVVGTEGLKVGAEVARTAATAWLMQYLGLPSAG